MLKNILSVVRNNKISISYIIISEIAIIAFGVLASLEIISNPEIGKIHLAWFIPLFLLSAIGGQIFGYRKYHLGGK